MRVPATCASPTRRGPSAPGPAAESYLNVERILRAAKQAGADAIHPGYGFLSENAGFAAACAAAGIAFIGPPVAAIEAMGSKSAAKARMQAAGVPTLPGYHGDEQSADALERRAIELGFPLIIKPSGGGGGKGMHIVNEAGELRAAIATARSGSPRRHSKTTGCCSNAICPRPGTWKCRCSRTSTAASFTCSTATAPCSVAIKS